MAKYRKAENCGPVPYPDRSGRFLNAGEVVEGDDWEYLVAVGYVVKEVEAVKTSATASAAPKASTEKEAPPAKEELPAKKEEAPAEEETPAEEAVEDDDESGDKDSAPSSTGRSHRKKR